MPPGLLNRWRAITVVLKSSNAFVSADADTAPVAGHLNATCLAAIPTRANPRGVPAVSLDASRLNLVCGVPFLELEPLLCRSTPDKGERAHNEKGDRGVMLD